MEIELIQRDVQKSKATQRKYWFAKCPYCRKIFSARYNDLIKGHTKSCGCLSARKDGKSKQKYLILPGDQFGSLMILNETKRDSRGRGYFLCLCKCGNTCEVRRDLLTSGNTQSCGCGRFKSRGQQAIQNLLIKNNIPFEKQKTFESCRFKNTNALARFDFYVNNQYLIEFDGEQHFSFKEKGWFTKEALIKTQERDQFKNNWCKENGIPLIRIPYWKLDSLTLQDLML